ncbi:MAG: sulfite exporter TauE/SafE family protein [Gammaproteobacteria bacterium]|nr:sulfite exporter TauE/SafE family protein [Gammaproteobacteria bacterium]
MDILTSPYFLASLFFVVAFIYSSVGLGGGSSYTALLAIFGFSSLVIPSVSLILNLVVTSIGSFNFIRNKHAKLKLVLPFLISSVPMAFLGGSLNLPKEIFHWALLVSLIFVALRIYGWRDTSFDLKLSRNGRWAVSLLAGGTLGLMAGIVGIGGGIYLVPLIIVLGLGTDKQAAACGAIFIWLNSFSGLISRQVYNTINLEEFIPHIIAVLVGGGLGSYLGASKYTAQTIEKILGMLILIAIVLLSQELLI